MCVCGGGVIILLAGYPSDVHSACVCAGGGSSFCLLVTYLMSILCVCGGVIILLAGYLPDVHSVCVGGGHHSAC